MQTSIAPEYAEDPRAVAAEQSLRKCVHCGFCLATCPTYTLLGDELDSPRGRIYLIKQVVEGHQPSRKTLSHLDRCLTCRSCETTCPSGVDYSHLLDNGRALVEEQVGRAWHERLMRCTLLAVLPYRNRIGPLVKLGQTCRRMLPAVLRNPIPIKQQAGEWPISQHSRTVLILDGCAQPSMTPATNAATARVLDYVGISVLRTPTAGCCGAIAFHLNRQPQARDFMRRNIDAWWPAIEAGVEALVTTASGCGVMIKDYGHLLAGDPEYADKARRVSDLCCDIVEVLRPEIEAMTPLKLSLLQSRAARIGPVAVHSPCTLQHGQKLPQVVESLLRTVNFNLTPVADAHLCCGSAGTYSLLQPGLSRQLRNNKMQALIAKDPVIIATGNIGCQLHLQSGTALPVVHWVELLDRLVANTPT